MKAYLASVLIVDHENYGMEDAKVCLSSLRGWYPSVIDCKEADIGEWDDDHPLNKLDTIKAECDRLFGAEKLTEIFVWVDYSAMDKYPRESYLTIEAARKRATSLLHFDINDGSEIAEEWNAFERGGSSFTFEDCETEFHRVKVRI
jgi:hypothetical protein